MAREPFNPNLIRAPQDKPGPRGMTPITVSELTALVKEAIESALPTMLHVVGQISNFKRHSSGHLYLTLKDRSSEVSCVMWRSDAAKLKFTPTDGLDVVATGRVEVFERVGRYQLYIRKLQPRGVGSLELAFRQLCERLAEEGLFDERHKKPLPPYPARIVVVTSPTSAALSDILRTIQRRYPCVEVLVYPTAVQGDGAAAQIAAAIRNVNAAARSIGGVDLMIVGRGGGSAEDRWAFNEEVVARAIHASRIPIISAVGHEVDVSVADLVADVRAATPTAAAELAVPVMQEVLADLVELEARLMRAIRTRADLLSARLAAVLSRSALGDPLARIYRREQSVDELSHRMHRRVVERLHTARVRLDTLEPTVQRIAPHTYLARTAVRLRDAEHRLRRVIERRRDSNERTVTACARRLEHAAPARILPPCKKNVARLFQLIVINQQHRLSIMAERIGGQEQRLGAMSYKSVLNRGFSITRTKKGGRVIRSTDQLKDRQRVVTELVDSEFESEVVNLSQLELFD
ncbi:MAG: exodeoxyribonuclease VII large subunit [Planctomycetes bacterium]|nr:exodeoxyribonuclease VII large subunit [Planctomycetota bacterium]